MANLLRHLADELRVDMLLISHDLAIVHRVADRTAVMYLGRLVESAPTRQAVSSPAHPYSSALIGTWVREGVRRQDPARSWRPARA